MSFFSNPIANISGGIHDLGKGIANATKNPLVDMAAAAALDYFVPGLGEAAGLGMSNAATAGLITGGIAGLSSGNLAQGLMAGMAGYGGASLGEGLAANAANTANTANELSAGYSGTGNPMASNAVETTKALGESGTLAPSSVAGDLSPNPAQGLRPSFAPAATDSAYSVASKPLTPMAGPLSGAADVAGKTSLWQDFKALPWYEQAGIGAAGIMGLKAMAKPQALNAPKGPNTQFIRYSSYSPMGGYRSQGMEPAAATGGLVALAHGGIAHYDDGGDVAAAAPAAPAAPAAITASDVANYLQANPGMSDAQIAAAMDKYNVNPALVAQATGLNVGDVQSRYNTVEAPPAAGGSYALPTGETQRYVTTEATGPGGNPSISNTDIQNYLQAHPGLSDAGIAQAMNQYGVSEAQMAAATGIAGPTISDRYNLATDISNQGKVFGAYTGPGTPMTNLGSAYDQQWASYMDAHKDPVTGQLDPIAVSEMARATGISEDEIGKRYAAAEAKLHPQKPVTPTTTTLGTTVGGPATQTLLPTNPRTNAPAGTTNPYGNVNNPGDITRNADGTTTITPNLPGRPYGGFSGVGEVTNAYTAGGGSTGYTIPTYKDMASFNAANNTMTGGSKAAYDYLMGNSPWNPLPTTPTGEVSVPYQKLMGQDLSPQYLVNTPQIYDPTTHTYKTNPNYDPHFSATKDYLGIPQTGITNPNALKTLGYTQLPGGIMAYPNPDGTYTGADGKKYKADGTLADALTASTDNQSIVNGAHGGLMSLAGGGATDDAKRMSLADMYEKRYELGMNPNDYMDPNAPIQGTSWYGTLLNDYMQKNPDLFAAQQYDELGSPVDASGLRTPESVNPDFLQRDRLLNAPYVPPSEPSQNVFGIGNDLNTGGGFGGDENQSGNNIGSQSATDLMNYMLSRPDLFQAPTYDDGANQFNPTPGVVPIDTTPTPSTQSYSDITSASAGGGGGGGIPDGIQFVESARRGGLMRLARGGMTVGHLGGYSDGGRLLRGPGDGVSDSIPATIGTHNPEPARLADGEFVVPARIVSELGNGSTEAGARQLYKMMDRIQKARQKTVGKNRVAANTNAAKYLPA